VTIVWLNGALCDADAARIEPTDRGFTMGDGLFETIRAMNGVPARLPRHFARLREGAGVLGLPVPHDDIVLERALREVLAPNALGDAVLRLTLTRGPAARGVLPQVISTPTLSITAAPLPAPLPPARVIVSQVTRRNAFSPLSRVKSLNYLDSILARLEAGRAGADDALLLNTQGDLAEATAGNVFLWVDGALLTPRIEDGALPGICRAVLLETHRITECRIPEHLIDQAQAGFLSNSLGLRSLSHIAGRQLETQYSLPELSD
jgi:branched-chain amino acid aminotransferase